MIGFIDSGTTNSRIFLVSEGKVISEGARKVGVRDTSITGSNKKLKEGIREAVLDAVGNIGAQVEDVSCFIASGMITSEIGLLEVPHLVAPVSKSDLASAILKVQDNEIFPFDVPVIFVRGIKNQIYGQNNRLDELPLIDFMRGEETQVIGICERYQPALPTNVIVVGSHFKLIHVDAEGRIAGSMTTISGQIFEALTKGTSIAASVADEEKATVDGAANLSAEDLLDVASGVIESGGLLRALLMPRFMQVLMKTTAAQRRSFVNAAIAAEDMRALESAAACGFTLATDYFVFGNEDMCRLYDRLIEKRFGSSFKRVLCYDRKETRDITIEGTVAIIKESDAAGLLDH
jgi:2-dehydro-3-deoxygalactonokinase